jgi:hypothetical protein
MTSSAAPAIDVRRAAERFHTDLGWLDSRHSFSFGGSAQGSDRTRTATWRSSPGCSTASWNTTTAPGTTTSSGRVWPSG